MELSTVIFSAVTVPVESISNPGAVAVPSVPVAEKSPDDVATLTEPLT